MVKKYEIKRAVLEGCLRESLYTLVEAAESVQYLARGEEQTRLISQLVNLTSLNPPASNEEITRALIECVTDPEIWVLHPADNPFMVTTLLTKGQVAERLLEGFNLEDLLQDEYSDSECGLTILDLVEVCDCKINEGEPDFYEFSEYDDDLLQQDITLYPVRLHFTFVHTENVKASDFIEDVVMLSIFETDMNIIEPVPKVTITSSLQDLTLEEAERVILSK